MKNPIGPKTAAVILVLFVVLIAAVAVFGISTSGAPVLPFTVIAAVATVLGLVFQALADFIPRWMSEDAQQQGKDFHEPSWIGNVRSVGHVLVIVGAVYFLATYLVPIA
ncbi:hypothetical protein [Microbacterium sp. MPKO10]|uniref:hypothetical protein n=1 Tax=Microbacterium sp. MPKO10 TaxID=2989818 RepID=UPI00223627F1|nr:hypothetical protein [Microbacterium sp. MPKO10]MCW4457444.1 hypothetical protein [Microbacterium sp. MPKO10]